MNAVTHKSNKSLIMQEIRLALKKKSEAGKPTLSRKESNRTWREDILGILSEDQKQQRKTDRQERDGIRKSKRHSTDEE